MAWLSYIVAGLTMRLFKSLASIRELRKLADHDPLTHLHNRRGLENHLQGLSTRIQDPNNRSLGVMMIDLDHFKQVNDKLGHDVGDEILRKLAAILRGELRANNLCARWGGEEFIALFPGISPDRLQVVAETIRKKIERDLHWKDHRITASLGISQGDVGDFANLSKRADQALYRAKEGGRNRVEVADPI
jgi:diguanylate cyclase (GGDEF)-like protein